VIGYPIVVLMAVAVLGPFVFVLTARWFHPDGSRYRAGPAPTPEDVIERQAELAAVSF
jgi:hypothetical protein